MAAIPSDSFRNVERAQSIGDAFWRRAREHPDSTLYRWASAASASSDREWHTETYAAAGPKVSRIAHYLRSLGVGVGTTVAIMSQTRPEWMLVDMAVQTLGGIAVSIYQSLPAHEAGYLLFDSKATIIFVENEEQAQKIAQLISAPCPIPEHEGVPASDVQLTISHVISFEVVAAVEAISLCTILSDTALPSDPPTIPEQISRESVASYVYTSGTTGPPKGVIQTHGNHLINIEQVCRAGVFPSDGTLFLYLPLAHSFARLAYYVGFLTSVSIVVPAITDHQTSKIDLSSVARDIREGEASVLPSVPRLFEKMAAALQARTAGRSIQQRILRACIKNAQSTYERRTKGEPLGVLEHLLFTLLAPIRAKIKKQLFGAGFRHGISGGAKLDPGVNRFFDALGILLCEGYGLTETCVATHVNLSTKRKIGSVGPALQGVEVKIAATDGEIIMRGPNVTQGYLHRPKATADSWDADGWFHTGDVGRLDDEGFLYITDRKKEIVVTAGGKKIAPQSIEGLFKRYPFISQALYFGDGKPHCVMLFTLNELELRTVLRQQGFELEPETPLTTVPAVRSLVDEAVREVNATLPSFETIKHFTILESDFTIENGLLTPTMKMKRKAITARYIETLEGMYVHSAPRSE